MAKLTHTVSGDNVASFRSADIANIESLKCHFLPVLEGSGDPSPENVRPISGWLECNIYKTGKNIGHITAYSATSGFPAVISNNYGTTLNTTTFSLPDTQLILTQSTWSTDYTATSYRNGYFNIFVDNLVFGLYYDISFKVTNITNPLNVNINLMYCTGPSGGGTKYPIVDGDIFIYKNVEYKPYTINNVIQEKYIGFSFRNCGMSFTLSEIMITPAGMSDGVWEPYYGEIIPITFPTTGKNKFFYDASNYTLEQIITGSGTTVNRYIYHTGLYGGTYTMSASIKDESNRVDGNYNLFNYGYMKNGLIYTIDNFIRTTTEYNRTITVTKDEEVVLIYTSDIAYSANRDIQKYNIQIECGDAATTYESYSTDHTYYGGYVDIATGEVWRTIKYYTFNGEERITDYSSGITGGKRLVSTVFDDCQSDVKYMYCDKAVVETSVQYQISHLGIRIGGGQGRFYFFVPDSMFDGEVTIDKFKQWLAENSLTATALLITPELVGKFTPMELKIFFNYNNIWSNTNNTTEVTYEIIDHLIAKRANIPRLKAKVIWNSLAYPQIKSGLVVNSSGNGTFHITCTMTKADYYTLTESDHYMTIIEGHKYYIHGCPVTDGSIWLLTTCGNNGNQNDKGYGTIATFPKSSDTIRILIRLEPGTYDFYITPVMVDLTQMFGAGNEPTLVEFEQLCKMNGININEALPFDLGTEKIWYINDYDITKYQTIEWNQLARKLNLSNYIYFDAENTLTASENPDELTIQYNVLWTDYHNCIKDKDSGRPLYYKNHKYYAAYEFCPSWNCTTIGLSICNYASPYYPSAPANEYTRMSYILEKTTDNGRHGILLAYPMNQRDASIGDTVKCRNVVVVDLTQMFGAGNEPTTAIEFENICLMNNIDITKYQPVNAGTKLLWRIK